MKDYQAETGVALDPTFGTHKLNCELCQRYDESKPATVALLCLEGSVLWKRENQVREKRAPVDRGQFWASKDEVKRLMKYKEL